VASRLGPPRIVPNSSGSFSRHTCGRCLRCRAVRRAAQGDAVACGKVTWVRRLRRRLHTLSVHRRPGLCRASGAAAAPYRGFIQPWRGRCPARCRRVRGRGWSGPPSVRCR
jgi:hypothetical protein